MYSWDECKNRANRVKHGISFEEARRVFEDPFHVTSLSGIKHHETRWQTIGTIDAKIERGTSGGFLELLVIHAGGCGDGGEENVRIISARNVSPSERRQFESLPVDQPKEVLGHAISLNVRGWFGAKGYRTRKRRT